MADNGVRIYFTYGAHAPEQPFHGGWTLVKAPTWQMAVGAFQAVHPSNSQTGLLNCCKAYSEEEFKATEMYKKGNFGVYCHEVITIKREVYGPCER